jgi:RNA polymerase sigma factor (sigma-70 family)
MESTEQMEPSQQILFDENRALAIHWAIIYSKKTRKATVQELLSPANEGLWQAAMKFDPDRGVRFSTYASQSIMNTIQHYLVAFHGWLRRGQVARAAEVTFSQLGNDEEGLSFDPGFHEPQCSEEFWDDVLKAVPEEHRTIFIEHYRERRTMASIAQDHGVTAEWIRQLRNRYFPHMKQRIAD